MPEQRKRIPARFYRNENGSEPVREWLWALDKAERILIGTDIKTVEYGWPIGNAGLSTDGAGFVRSKDSSGGESNGPGLFCISESKMVLLHGFVKKSQKTAKTDLDLAIERQRVVERER